MLTDGQRSFGPLSFGLSAIQYDSIYLSYSLNSYRSLSVGQTVFSLLSQRHADSRPNLVR